MKRRRFVQGSLAGLGAAVGWLAGLSRSMAAAVARAAGFPAPQGSSAHEEAQIAHGSPRKRMQAEVALNKWQHTWVPVAEKEVRVRPIEVEGDFTGLYITSDLDNNVGYALGVVGREKVRFGGGLGKERGAWGSIAAALPPIVYSFLECTVQVGCLLGYYATSSSKLRERAPTNLQMPTGNRIFVGANGRRSQGGKGR